MFPDAKKPNHVHEQYYVSLNDKTPFLSFFLSFWWKTKYFFKYTPKMTVCLSKV